jgi:hypothetical protein
MGGMDNGNDESSIFDNQALLNANGIDLLMHLCPAMGTTDCRFSS